ncbi:hypothetical protein J7J26_04010 [Candidatus Micrarchaeota archaeon]|nr:hypothetical protein [Candidatus Micrarchaeota archaeon]
MVLLVLIISSIGIYASDISLYDLIGTMNESELTTCSSYAPASTHGIPDFLSLTVIGLMLSVAVIVIVYMVSKLFNIDRGVAWSMHESYQVIVTVIIFILIIFLWSTIEDVGKINNPVDPTGNTTMFESSLYYVKTIRNMMIESSVLLWIPNAEMYGLGSVEMNFVPLEIVGVSFDYKVMFMPVKDVINWLTNLVSPLIFTWFGKEFLLCAVQRIIVPVFLPLGIIFRAFQPTRGIGGGLIALSFGLYFVYPLMLNINNIILANHYGASPDIIKTSAGAGLFGGVGYNGFLIDIMHEATVIGGGVFTMPLLNAFLFIPLLNGVILLELQYLFITTFIDIIVYPGFIASVILPIINVLITLSFIREFSILLGSDMSFSDLLRLL